VHREGANDDRGVRPAQLLLGAAIGFVPSAIQFFLDGRRLKAERIRQQKIVSLDAAVGRMNTLLDHAAATVATRAAGQPVHGVLAHDPLAYYSADQSLIPDQATTKEFTPLRVESWAVRCGLATKVPHLCG
jgi:hypothetical protein